MLDDGFQHWSLKRDADIVLIRPEDLTGHLLPRGHLRESPQALERADLVLEIAKDVFKRSVLPEGAEEHESFRDACVLTTRAPDPDFAAEIRRILGEKTLRFVALADHAPRSEILKALELCQGCVVLGRKEWVKLWDWKDLSRLPAGGHTTESGVPIKVMGLNLEFTLEASSHLDALLERALRRAHDRIKGEGC